MNDNVVYIGSLKRQVLVISLARSKPGSYYNKLEVDNKFKFETKLSDCQHEYIRDGNDVLIFFNCCESLMIEYARISRGIIGEFFIQEFELDKTCKIKQDDAIVIDGDIEHKHKFHYLPCKLYKPLSRRINLTLSQTPREIFNQYIKINVEGINEPYQKYLLDKLAAVLFRNTFMSRKKSDDYEYMFKDHKETEEARRKYFKLLKDDYDTWLNYTNDLINRYDKDVEHIKKGLHSIIFN